MSQPLEEAINMDQEAAKLVKSDKLDDFVTMLNFIDEKKAIAFAQCVHKCRKSALKKREEFFFLIARSMVSVKTGGKTGGNRAQLFAQTLMGVAVPEFFGGGSDARSRRGNKENT
jgi:Na+-translocating ferredoxin:NAD+ oxidoreductase RNF subunit RnfB